MLGVRQFSREDATESGVCLPSTLKGLRDTPVSAAKKGGATTLDEGNLSL
jgi:hypothetical protein